MFRMNCMLRTHGLAGAAFYTDVMYIARGHDYMDVEDRVTNGTVAEDVRLTISTHHPYAVMNFMVCTNVYHGMHNKSALNRCGFRKIK